jgi:hypothetical protein
LSISEYRKVNKDDKIDLEFKKKKKDVGHDYEDNKKKDYN